MADAHRDDGKRFVVQADDKLTAFLELAGWFPKIVLTPFVEDGQNHARAKFVRLLPELYLTLFPQGIPERRARSHKQEKHENSNQVHLCDPRSDDSVSLRSYDHDYEVSMRQAVVGSLGR